MMTESEHDIQSKIQIALSTSSCTVFRINVGKWYTIDKRWVTTGVPNGYFDLSGFRWSDGKAFFIEVKRPVGRIRPDQISFHKMLTRHHIIHGIARSTDDALKIVKNKLVGFGFPDYKGEHE